MDENVRYVFKKPYVTPHGTLQENSEIRFFRGGVYFDGGLVPGAYAAELMEIVNNKKLCDEYLVKQHLVKNVIA